MVAGPRPLPALGSGRQPTPPLASSNSLAARFPLVIFSRSLKRPVEMDTSRPRDETRAPVPAACRPPPPFLLRQRPLGDARGPRMGGSTRPPSGPGPREGLPLPRAPAWPALSRFALSSWGKTLPSPGSNHPPLRAWRPFHPSQGLPSPATPGCRPGRTASLAMQVTQPARRLRRYMTFPPRPRLKLRCGHCLGCVLHLVPWVLWLPLPRATPPLRPQGNGRARCDRLRCRSDSGAGPPGAPSGARGALTSPTLHTRLRHLRGFYGILNTHVSGRF